MAANLKDKQNDKNVEEITKITKTQIFTKITKNKSQQNY